jgi:hypothetical protein
MAEDHAETLPRAHSKRDRRHAVPKKKHTLRRSILFSLLGVLIIVLAAGVWIGVRALTAKSALEAAVGQVKTVSGSLSSFDTSTLGKTYDGLHKNTSTAVDMTSDWVWGAAEKIPGIGANLLAFRQTAVVVNDLVEDGLHPVAKAATGVSIASLKPVNGKIDLKPIAKLSPAVVKAAAAVAHANKAAKAIDTSSTIGILSSKVTELRQMLAKVDPPVQEAAKVLPLVAPALGSTGPRHYLMMFQGNSEVRALGGNPAAMAVIEMNDGVITITKQYSSSNFHNARPQSVEPLNPAVEHIYSDIIGRWIPNITSTPDYPTAVSLMRAYFAEEDSTKLDGVISLDPVALSYLLKVTGPAKMATGDTLTSANAVSLLLNEAYFKYPEGADSNAFFAEAAVSAFKVLTSGKGDPAQLLKAIVRSVNEGRLMYWSANPAEAAALKDTRLAGTLPTSNADATVVGAYVNDVTGSKMDYYIKGKATTASTQCTAPDKPVFTETVTLSNVIDPNIIPTLPLYITGPYYTPGTVATDVVVYGPVGGTITGWKSSGGTAEMKTSGAINGRPVYRIQTTLKPGENITLTYTMTAPKGKFGPLEMRTTPMVWPTPTTVSSPGCAVAKK